MVFETLSDLEVSEDLNALRVQDWDRNVQGLRDVSNYTLVLDGAYEELSLDEPVMLEDEATGDVKAYALDSVSVDTDNEITTLTVTPKLPSAFVMADTIVHLQPKERLQLIGPETTGAQVGKTLYLTDDSDLLAGEVVLIGASTGKPYFRRLKSKDDRKLTFHNSVGDLNLSVAKVSRPITISVGYQGARTVADNGAVLQILYVAGDWRYLIDKWLCDKRTVDGKTYLPVYQVINSNYYPVGGDPSTGEEPVETAEEFAELLYELAITTDGLKPGYTALTVAWHPNADGMGGNEDFSLNNPQSILAPANVEGTWGCDTFIQKTNGKLPDEVTTTEPKKTVAGDMAVVSQSGQLAWSKLASVSIDRDAETAALEAENGWQDRGGGPFYLGRSTVYSHFKHQARLQDREANPSTFSGTDLVLESIPSGLAKGRMVMVEAADNVFQTTVKAVYLDPTDEDDNPLPSYVELTDEVADEVAISELVIYANVVNAGHGVTRNTRVLGSGDGSKNNQTFLFEMEEVSFEADATLSAGVRAAIDIKVEGVSWEQVSTLKDSSPSDNHYTVRMTEDRHLNIIFGDGKNGRRLPTGSNNVRIDYRQGVGSNANLDAASLAKIVKPHYLVDSVAQPLASGGGADMESLDSLRTEAPAALLTLERCVSLRDFALLTRQHSSYAQAEAFALPTGFGQRESIEVVVVPTSGETLTEQMKTELNEYLVAHALPGVNIQVDEYSEVNFSIEASVQLEAGYDEDTVSEALTAALTEAFSIDSRKLGQSLYRGEIYQVAEGVEGVRNTVCTMACDDGDVTIATGRDGVIRVIAPSKRQCVHLVTGQPQITITIREDD